MQPTHTPDWWTENLEVSDLDVPIDTLRAPLHGFLVEAGDIHAEMFNCPLMLSDDGFLDCDSSVKHDCGKAVDIYAARLTDNDGNSFVQALIPLQKKYSVGIFDRRYIGALLWHVETV